MRSFVFTAANAVLVVVLVLLLSRAPDANRFSATDRAFLVRRLQGPRSVVEERIRKVEQTAVLFWVALAFVRVAQFLERTQAALDDIAPDETHDGIAGAAVVVLLVTLTLLFWRIRC